MLNFSRCLTAAGVALLILGGQSLAQYHPTYGQYRPGSRTQLSPYLNLLRDQGGNNGQFSSTNFAVNYFLGTIPEQQRRLNTARFSSDIRQLEQTARTPAVTGDPDADLFRPLPTTGHPTGFSTTGGYFPAAGAGHPAQSRNLPPAPHRRTTPR